MTAARPRYTPLPRLLSERAIAAMLDKGYTKFREIRPQLEAEGFPKIDKLIGGTDSVAVNRWLDRRSGLPTVDAGDEIDDPLMEALNDCEN